MLQAAHQPAAYAGDLGGIQGQILLLCHLDGHRNKIRQMCMTTQRSAADADPSQNFRLVPHTDLPQFYAGLKHARQILHQLAEVDTTVRGEIEQHLIVVESIFRIDQFHLQTVLLNLLQTDFKGILLLLLIGRFLLLVSFRSDPQHRLQGLNHLVILHFPGIADCRAELNASGSLHYHIFSSLYLKMQRVKKIDLTRSAKPYTNYFCHLYTSLFILLNS